MSNQVQTTTKRDIRDFIQSDAVKRQIAMVLPKHLTPDRMARVTCTAILKTPKLATCRPESLLQALMLCSQAGLEPDGRNAHLIPYGDQVQVIFDWKGLVSLARRNGVQNIAADVVCENDVFEWHRDAEGLHFRHQIDYRKPRGAMFAAFCIWKDAGQFDGDVMTKEDIDAIRKRSKAGNSGPWVTDYNEMAKKTVVRRASKKWPLDAEIADVMDKEAQADIKPAGFKLADMPMALPEPEPTAMETAPAAMSATVARATSSFRPQVVPPPAAALDDHADAPAAEPPPVGDLPPVGDEEPPAADDGVDPNKPNLADSTALRDAVEGIGYTFWLFSRAAAELEIDGAKEWRNWMDVPSAIAREACDNLPMIKARMARLKAEEAKARAAVPPTAKK